MTAKYVPGYDKKYLVDREERKIYRDDDGEYVEVSQSGEPPRVRLHQNGNVYRPYVRTVIEDTFDQ